MKKCKYKSGKNLVFSIVCNPTPLARPHSPAMFPLIFCSLCAQIFWCVRTFLQMTSICATTHLQQYVCATICLCAVSP